MPGDFEGDGKADIGVYNDSDGRWLILTSSSGYNNSIYQKYGGTGWLPVPNNFDGDDKADIGIHNEGNGRWLIKTSSSDYTNVFSKQWGGSGWTPLADSW